MRVACLLAQVCSGQSNMARPVSLMNGSVEEIKRAGEYESIRLFQVDRTMRSKAPMREFDKVCQPWDVPNASNPEACLIHGPNGTITGRHPAVSAFAASCWYFGRDLFDGWSFSQKVPLGLVLSSWGGTTDRTWSSPRALSHCPNHTGPGGYRTNKSLHHDAEMWNSMISPMLSMTIKGVVFYQGEGA